MALCYDLPRGAGREHHQPVGLELILPLQLFPRAGDLRVILLYLFLLDTALGLVMGLGQMLREQHKFVFQVIVKLLAEPQIVLVVGQRAALPPVAVRRDLGELPVKISNQLVGGGVFQRPVQAVRPGDAMGVQPGKQFPAGLMSLPAQYAQQQQVTDAVLRPLEPGQVRGLNLKNLPQIFTLEVKQLLSIMGIAPVYNLGCQPKQLQLDKKLNGRVFAVGRQIGGHLHLIVDSLIERLKLAVLPGRPLQLPLQVLGVEVAAGFRVEIRPIQEHHRGITLFPRGQHLVVVRVVVRCCFKCPIRALPDHDAGFLVKFLLHSLSPWVDAGCLDDARHQLSVPQTLDHSGGFPVIQMPALSVGLHGELPPAAGTRPFAVMAGTLHLNLLAAGGADAPRLLRVPLGVIVKIGRKDIPADLAKIQNPLFVRPGIERAFSE